VFHPSAPSSSENNMLMPAVSNELVFGLPPVSAYLRRSGCDEVTNPISDSLANLELNCWLAQSLWADELALRFFGAARARKSSEHHAPRDRSLPFVVASLGYLKLLRHFQTRAEM